MQAAGGGTAIPFLTDAARSVDVADDMPLVIADYGSAQGKNSLVPLRAAIATLRARVGEQRSSEVLASNPGPMNMWYARLVPDRAEA